VQRTTTDWRLVRKWLLPTLAIIAALGVTVAVLVLVHPGQQAARTSGQPGQFVAAENVPDGPNTDIGRRITLNGPEVQLLVPQPPRCGLTSFGGATATGGTFCVVRLTLLNLGGVAVPVGATAPKLVDDEGGEHALHGASTTLPKDLAPGDKIDGVLVFELPPSRGPARLVLRDGVEVRL
jgi:hypothetical protein